MCKLQSTFPNILSYNTNTSKQKSATISMALTQISVFYYATLKYSG